MAELDTARRMIIRGKTELAASILAEFIAEHPDRADAWLLMAQAVSDPAKKLDCYHRVLEIEPANSIALKGVRSARQQLMTAKAVEEKVQTKSDHAAKVVKSKPPVINRKYLLRIALPVLVILVITIVGIFLLRKKPIPTSSISTPSTPLATQATPITTITPAVPSSTEVLQNLFSGFSTKVFYVQNSKLWSWQSGVANSLTEVPAMTSIRVIQEGQKIIFTKNAALWAIMSTGGTPVKILDLTNPLNATPSPSSSNTFITISGYLPKTASILVSVWSGDTSNTQDVNSSALYSVKADGSGVMNFVAIGQGGVPCPSPNERYLAVVNSHSIQLVDLTGGTPRGTLSFPPLLPEKQSALPIPIWSADSSHFEIAIPPYDIASDLNSPTAVWMVDSSGVRISLPPITTRGGKVFISSDLKTILYQLNLSSVDDLYGEIHKVTQDGSTDTILLEGKLAHLVGWGSQSNTFFFQPKDDPTSLWTADTITGKSTLLVSGLDGDSIIRYDQINEQLIIVETGQTTGHHLWLVRNDGRTHQPLLLAENQVDQEIPFDFVP